MILLYLVECAVFCIAITMLDVFIFPSSDRDRYKMGIPYVEVGFLLTAGAFTAFFAWEYAAVFMIVTALLIRILVYRLLTGVSVWKISFILTMNTVLLFALYYASDRIALLTSCLFPASATTGDLIKTCLFGALSLLILIVFWRKSERRISLLFIGITRWRAYAAFSFCYLICILALEIVSIAIPGQQISKWCVLPFLIMCMLHIRFLFSSAEEITAYRTVKANEEWLIRQGELLQEEKERIVSDIEELRKMRHEFRHQSAVAGELIRAGNLEAAQEFLKELGDIGSAAGSRKVYCENPVINAVISFYAQRAEEWKVNLSCDIRIAGEFRFSETDVACVFSNLLENALDAVRDLDVKEIQLRAAYQKQKLYIETVNPFVREPVFIDGRPVSTKVPSSGYGTKLVEDIANRYHGMAVFEADAEFFTAKVLLNGAAEEKKFDKMEK